MDEKKKYEIVGTVTIGSDEYRDLIESAIRNEVAAEDQRNQWWKELNRADKAVKELAEITKKYNKLKEFVQSDADTYGMYMTWLAERGEKE